MTPGDLKGKKVVLTGTFVTMKRDEAERLLTAAGVLVGGSVSKTTDVLVHGENAGSKLAKATSLGVALMTEAEMVASLAQMGSVVAGASEKIARAKADAGPESAVAAAVAELKVFIETLKKRPDVSVRVATVGRKATKGDLAFLERQGGIPRELLELYAAVNGVHVEWQFIEPPGGGQMRIPPLTGWTRFAGDDSTYMGFGDDQDALLLDEIQAEGGTWLVRDKESGGVRIVFASAAEGMDGIEPASTIARYIRDAIDHGLVYYWPRCFRQNRYVSYAEQEAAVERFRARPEKPLPIRVGGRVEFEYFSEGGRGVVLALHEAPQSRATDFCGRKLAQVKLDEGSVGWLPEQWMKALKKNDAYERMRDPGFDFRAAAESDLLGLMADVARAIGPLFSHSSCSAGMFPSNARRAAGLLSTRAFGEAFALVVDLHRAAKEAKLDLVERLPLAKTGQEFSATEHARYQWAHTIEGSFGGLFGGLFLLACHESARRGVPGRDLVDAALRDGVPTSTASASLVDVLSRAEVLPALVWHHDPEGKAARELGLPEGAAVMQGAGF